MTHGGFALDARLAADTHPLGELPLSRVLLMDDARFGWLVLVPRRAGLRELTDLDAAAQTLLLGEIDRCARALLAVCNPHKLNIAMLGNVVEQLHVHVVARAPRDAAWPGPVWGCGRREAYAADALASRSAALRDALGFAGT